MDAPLFKKITELTNKYPLHMPGHKRRAAFLPPDLLSLDITEIEGSDNLHAPKGAIMQAQQKLARLYGADESIICVNGGSSGILAAVLGTCKEGDTLLAVRNAHKSLQNALILSGAGAVYADTPVSSFGFALPVTADIIEKALLSCPEIKAVFIVSPTYEGFCADVRRIADIVHKYNKILIVDETHGAHFPFDPNFPENAIRQGADISIESWHKTLPLPNQCAVLNVNTKRVDIERIRQAFSMVTTTSPSYIFMGLTDYVRAYYEENDTFAAYTKRLKEIKARLKGLEKLVSAENIINGCDYDISKFTFVNNSSESTEKITGILKGKYGFELEMCAVRHFIAMTSPADDLDMLDKFADALIETDKKLEKSKAEEKILLPEGFSDRVVQRQMFYADKEKVPLEKAVGRISADFITPFPPDIPLVLAGEIITTRHIEEIKKMQSSGAEILGLEDEKVQVLCL